MAKASLTLTAKSKAIDFHRNQGAIVGLDSDDEYIMVSKITKYAIYGDSIHLFLDDGHVIRMPYTEVETVGLVTHVPNFPSIGDFESALQTLLDL